MNTMRKGVLPAMLLALLAVQPASAQQELPAGVMLAGRMDDAPGFEPGPPGDRMPEGRREEIRKKVAAVRIYRLTEELKLDPETSARIAALLGSIDSDRVMLMREQREGMRKLRELVAGGKAGERKLKEVLDGLESNHRRKMDLREREWKGIKDLLSVEQQARYLLFQQQFLREMRGMIAGPRGGQGPGPGPGGMMDE